MKHNFTIENIPFGIFSIKNGKKRLATILNDQVVNLSALADLGYFDDLKIKKSIFKKDCLNDFIALGKEKTNAVRHRLQEILSNPQTSIRNPKSSTPLMPSASSRLGVTVFYDVDTVQLHLPIKIGDYTDFYSSEQHATNVGMMFRNPENALLPNWKHMPIAYHGRVSSIFVSGTNFHRPKGQINSDDSRTPLFSETKRLDFELEVATVIGKSNPNGQPIDVNDAEKYVFGFMLFNDFSARDIQRWEYVPLGPFLAKNFFSSVSPWVVTLEALQPFRVPAPPQNPEVLHYLKEKRRLNFDIQLEVYLFPNIVASRDKSIPYQYDNDDEPFKICTTNFSEMYWTVAQQIAHHTVNGCNLNIGDVLASGTISGKTPDSFGSLLELTWGGKNPLVLPHDIKRTFLEDGDEIVIRGFAERAGHRIDFGAVRTIVMPGYKPTRRFFAASP